MYTSYQGLQGNLTRAFSNCVLAPAPLLVLYQVDPDLRWKAATAAQALSYLLFTSDDIRVASDAEVAAWLVEKKEVLAITLRSGISGSILQAQGDPSQRGSVGVGLRASVLTLEVKGITLTPSPNTDMLRNANEHLRVKNRTP